MHDEARPSRTAERVAKFVARHINCWISHEFLMIPWQFPSLVSKRPRSCVTRFRQMKIGFRVPCARSWRRGTRYAEDQLAAAVARGVRQYVVLGAGLDTFAYRNCFRDQGLRVFELDHPATQAWKRERLKAAGINAPAEMSFRARELRKTEPAPGAGEIPDSDATSRRSSRGLAWCFT